MGEHHATKWQQQALWNVALYMHICRLFAKLQRISVTAHSKDQIDWLIPECFQYGQEEVGPVVLHCPERGINSELVSIQPGDPIGQLFFP